MVVTTRRRAAAEAVRRPSNLKGSPTSRSAVAKQAATSPIKKPAAAKKPAAKEPARTRAGKLKGGKRRLRSLPENDGALAVASQPGKRLYDGPAIFSADTETLSPTVLTTPGRLPQKAKFFHRKLGQISAELATGGEPPLFEAHLLLDRVLEKLLAIAQK